MSVVAFYYFLEQKDKFNMNTAILTATITISFVMRNTSPIGWIPLLAIKVLFEGSLIPFIKAGIFVAIPLLGITIAIDTLYYLGTVNGTDWVYTSYNFLEKNLMYGFSEYFGTDPVYHYMVAFGPAIFTAMYPTVLYSMITHWKTQRNMGLSPYLTYYNGFYLLVFSLIKHKELRFLLPIVPFAFIMAGELLEQTIK